MKLIIRGKELILPLSEEQLKELEQLNGKEIEIIKGANDLFILRAKAFSQGAVDFSSDSKIIELLHKKSLSERVEGKFEKLLNKDENSRLRELIKSGKVFVFKLPKYKKGVYKLEEKSFETPKNPFEQKKEPSKNPGNHLLSKDGFLVLKNETEAKELSNSLRERIEAAEIKGIKGFDGAYYVIETSMYKKIRPALLECFKTKKSLSCEEITKMVNASRDLIKTACEFLKDEGEIFEKRKEQYQLA